MYDYNTFKELYDVEINYAYEPQYGINFGTNVRNGNIHSKYVSFHKLTVYDDGTCEYKGVSRTFDPRLWPKVVAFAEMLIETKAEKVLFKK